MKTLGSIATEVIGMPLPRRAGSYKISMPYASRVRSVMTVAGKPIVFIEGVYRTRWKHVTRRFFNFEAGETIRAELGKRLVYRGSFVYEDKAYFVYEEADL